MKKFFALAALSLLGIPQLAAQAPKTEKPAAQNNAAAKPGTASPKAAPAAPRRLTPEELRAEAEKKLADHVEFKWNQPYAGNDNPKQQVDVFLPKTRNSDKPLPCVVFIHGGGWVNGDRKGYAGSAAALAATGDYAAVSVGYRLSTEVKWPNQIHDCKAAIRYIRAHANEWNIDPDRLGATGSSAGGHLVTLLGLSGGNADLEGDIGEYTSQSSNVRCVVNYCGPTDMGAPLMQGDAAKVDDPAVAGLIGGPLKDNADKVKAASPLTHVSAKAVPIMTVHGTADMRVNFTHAVNLDAALKKAGASHLLIEMKGAPHGLPTNNPELVKRVRQFWDLHLRDIKSDISAAPIDVGGLQPAK
jgi:acetyl esterase/lipase